MIFSMDGQFDDHGSSTTTSFSEPDVPRLQSSAIDPDLEEHPSSNMLDAKASSRPNLQTEPDTIDGHALHAAHNANRRNVHSTNRHPFMSAQSSEQNFSGHQGTQMAISVEASSARSDRALPSREVTESTVEDAFVSFILYCNPSVDLDISTIELRKGFRAPPRSDGKSFNTYNLFKLIKRLEEKELKTWTQLVIELGVEPPDQNQSTQKVQQYAVRLKRWLHAFHVDAFFQYCLGKPNTYYTQVPSSEIPHSDLNRDGVPPEEDLALRALLPEWRPKRGRRKAEDVNNVDTGPLKRVHLDVSTSAAAEDFSSFSDSYSAYTQSAFPWSANPSNADAWAAAQVAIAPRTPGAEHNPTQQPIASQVGTPQIRWRLNDREGTPSTPYPRSAITPSHRTSATPLPNEPQSAYPQPVSFRASPSRSRRRHGPAVSAAWSSGSNPTTGKLRGRPPSNRSVRDGPFSTFPANPQTKEVPTISAGTPTYAAVPASTSDPASSEPPRPSHYAPTPPSHQNPTPTLHFQPLARKPSKLQLQVPEHLGAPVRLATPPRVLINGEMDQPPSPGIHGPERRSSADFFNEVEDTPEEERAEESPDEVDVVDWKRRAMALKRKLRAKEEELQALKRRVMEAVMR
ncbi:MAG: hypothetical protein FRX48_06407 [Lasallia pustulata]|uniref:ARS binding protein 2 n=1 Tax=Lasallia pustulata TaxID=136370 RepID=A0A5M8PLG9_9LECA|nr:MAG: hypothetical protein FRX48_06407 [Lasallia pustulata]